MREFTDVPKTPLWLPNNIEATTPYHFMQFVSKRQNVHLATYHDLHAWSVHKDTADSFWKLACEFLELEPQVSSLTGSPTVSVCYNDLDLEQYILFVGIPCR